MNTVALMCASTQTVYTNTDQKYNLYGGGNNVNNVCINDAHINDARINDAHKTVTQYMSTTGEHTML